MNESSGEPAFPCDWIDSQPLTGDQVVRQQYFGMTIRAYFAIRALQSLITNQHYGGELQRIFDKDKSIANAGDRNKETPHEYTARIALSLADALIAELEKKPITQP